MSETLSIDTLVVGGGVAGLFTLDALVRAGHAALKVAELPKIFDNECIALTDALADHERHR